MANGPVKPGRRIPAKSGTNGPNDKGGGTKTYKPAMPKPQHSVGPVSGKHKNAR